MVVTSQFLLQGNLRAGIVISPCPHRRRKSTTNDAHSEDNLQLVGSGVRDEASCSGIMDQRHRMFSTECVVYGRGITRVLPLPPSASPVCRARRASDKSPDPKLRHHNMKTRAKVLCRQLVRCPAGNPSTGRQVAETNMMLSQFAAFARVFSEK